MAGITSIPVMKNRSALLQANFYIQQERNRQMAASDNANYLAIMTSNLFHWKRFPCNPLLVLRHFAKQLLNSSLLTRCQVLWVDHAHQTRLLEAVHRPENIIQWHCSNFFKLPSTHLDHLLFSTRWLANRIDSRQSSFRLFTQRISQKHKWWNWTQTFCDFHDFLYQTKASSRFPFMNSRRALKKRNQTPFGYSCGDGSELEIVSVNQKNLTESCCWSISSQNFKSPSWWLRT